MSDFDFDFVDYLNSEADIEQFLQEVLNNGSSQKAIRQAFVIAEQARAKLNNQTPSLQTVDMLFNMLFCPKKKLPFNSIQNYTTSTS